MGAYTEIVDFTFTANETSRTFSGLSITKDDFVKVVMTHVNGSSSGTTIQLFPNTSAGVSGFNTTANYHNQVLFGSGSTVGASRQTGASYLFTPGSKTSANIGYFKISENNRYNSFVNNTVETGTTLEVAFRYATSSGVTFADAITSLTFFTTIANGIGTGSRIQIYKLDAVKVADITVTSNTTQVDISNLSIDKDSEYLLVSDKPAGAAFGNRIALFVNDNTTESNYNSQRILASGSSASASRFNAASYLSSDGTNGLAYTHIKLSNIGAYTAQSYNLVDFGTTAPIIINYSLSSTAENITSITKLNIVANKTNAIGAGSRFILYKLYE